MNLTRAWKPARTSIIIAAILAIAGLLFAGSQANSAHAATARTASTTVKAGADGAKPTIVLVHGAWADSGSPGVPGVRCPAAGQVARPCPVLSAFFSPASDG